MLARGDLLETKIKSGMDFFHKSTMVHKAHNKTVKLKDTQGKDLRTHK